jgi:hypothetical protein
MDNELPANELHRWVIMTEACLNKTKPDKGGFIRPKRARRLNTLVGKESVHRSMLIWDRILKAAQARRFKVRMEKEPPCRTIVIVDGEELSVSIKEKTTRKEHIATPEEMELAKGYTHLFQPPKWDLLPSGKLVLAIDSWEDNRMINEVTWTDGEKKRIEDRLDSISEVLLDVAKELKERRIRREEWRRKQEDERRKEKEARRLRVREKKRLKKLTKQVSVWKRAVAMRRLVQAVREEAIRRHGGIEPGSLLENWIQWADGQADRIDPVPALAMMGNPHNSAERQAKRPAVSSPCM